MKKLFSYIAIPALAIALISVLAPDVAHAQQISGGPWGGFDVVGIVLAPLGNAVMVLVSQITKLAGVALNAAVYYTIVQMAQTFTEVEAIDNAWRVVRDLANMGFIFVLLYASIMTIVGKEPDARNLIVKMVIAAILINFSLFFTKVVIDIANLLALTFYASMAPGAEAGASQFLNAGISNSMMDALRVNSIWDNRETLTGSNVFIFTILSSVVLLITAFVFFAVAIMLMIRYVVLIFVLILSPIAFVANILPGLDTYAKQWKDALIGQAFFAPIYFFLTWVTLFVAGELNKTTFASTSGIGTAFAGTDPGAMSTIVSFAVIIIFLIISLITAKKYADMAPAGVQKITKWAMGAAGGASFGLASRLGRATAGRFGQSVAENQDLRERAARGGFTGRLARLQIAAGKKMGAASYDARGTPLNDTLQAGEAISGYKEHRESKIKARMEQAKDLDQVITGNDVENEMSNRRWTSQADQAILQGLGITPAQIAAINANGASKNQIRDLGIDARQAEAMRRHVQQNLIEGSKIENVRRQEEFLHNISQEHWYTPNLYNDVSEDAEAARRMREGRKVRTPEQESQRQTMADAMSEALKNAGLGTPGTPPPTPSTGGPTPPPTTPPPPPPPASGGLLDQFGRPIRP